MLAVVLVLAVVFLLEALMVLAFVQGLASVQAMLLHRCWLLEGRDVSYLQVALCCYHSDFPSVHGSIPTNWMSPWLQL